MRIGKFKIGFFSDSKYKKIAIALLIAVGIAVAVKVGMVIDCINKSECLYDGIKNMCRK